MMWSSLSRFSRTVRQLIWSLFGGPSIEPPADPYAGVRVPTKGGPSGRAAAVALAEPGDDERVTAVGR